MVGVEEKRRPERPQTPRKGGPKLPGNRGKWADMVSPAPPLPQRDPASHFQEARPTLCGVSSVPVKSHHTQNGKEGTPNNEQ